MVTTFTLLVFKKCRTSEFFTKSLCVVANNFTRYRHFGKNVLQTVDDSFGCLIGYQVGDEQIGVKVHDVEGRGDLPSFECEFLFEDHEVDHPGVHGFSWQRDPSFRYDFLVDRPMEPACSTASAYKFL